MRWCEARSENLFSPGWPNADARVGYSISNGGDSSLSPSIHPTRMSFHSDLRRDLLALVLLAITLFLGASLITFDPADPPSDLVFPSHTQVINVCGPLGATVAFHLLEWLGLGSWYLVLSLCLTSVTLLMRQPITRVNTRIVGWLVSLVSLLALADCVFPTWSPGSIAGPGGYLGFLFRYLAEQRLGYLGTVGAFFGTFSLGFLLWTDLSLVRAITTAALWPVKGILRGLVVVAEGYGVLRRASETTSSPAKPKAAFPEEEQTPSSTAGDKRREVESDSDSSREIVVKKPAQVAPIASTQATEEELPSGSKPAERRVSEPRIRKPVRPPREELLEEIECNSRPMRPVQYKLPSIDLLLEPEPFRFEEQEKEVRAKAQILEKTFADFGYHVRVVEIQTGPVIAQFEVELEAGLRLSKITALADDLAIALRVPSVRIVAPIPGKNTVGIEVPNNERQIVRLREVIEESHGKYQAMRIPIFLGKDVAGHPMVVDLATMPHLLIAGRTGTGKSVCLNSIILSILMTKTPDEVRLLLIDPKMVELSPYKRVPHLMHPVVTDMRKAEAILAWAVEKMEERYALLARAGVRHLSVYNQLGEEELMRRMRPESEEERAQIPTHMPYIVIIADEMADLMMTAAKEVETHIIRLAQKSRAVGIHLVLATQKPTVDVITGLIKSNLPARICFEVASRVDSRVVLDEMGAEKLLGNGDMLFLRPGTSTLIRGQGTYVSDDEINRVIDAVAVHEPEYVQELVQLKPSLPEQGQKGAPTARDELYEAAVDIIIREGRGSVSLLQRALGIGYGRAARLIDYMEEDGIVGPYNGSQAREVLMTLEQWEAIRQQRSGSLAHSPPVQPPSGSGSPRTNRIVLVPETNRPSTENPFTAPREEPPASQPGNAAGLPDAT
ncbi:Cell division protein FtsK [Thermogutta terrifontis]|uniref:Cell division protein FtsK n=1 Tax=Thermogutta terrifontis TaxID=1331910 RepID=A0A286RIZ7_9BACT|nr:DNA translocase FtsK [Thermogutta terrifontis]ASV75933.1 Cell division protein FtsK [Thermogutta terrifontis]